VTQVIEDYKPSAREALDQHRWADAYLILKEAEAAGLLPAEDLEAFSEASWWNGKHDESLEVRERAFNAYISEEKPAKAAEMAVFLSREFGQKGEDAKAGAWFMRAERLLAPLEECEEHGYLYMGRAMGFAFKGQWEEAIPEARRALDIGNRYLNKDIQAFAICIEGMALVNSGDVKEGLNLIDEAAVAAVSGELRPFSTGFLYCMAISQSRDLADYRRAGEWTEAAKRWCERQSINGFPGVCRVHKAEILALRGNWAEAEQEARKASDELMNFNLGFIASNGFYEIGEIRLRMGDLPAAEDAFRQAHQMGRNPEPGMTMLRVAQGTYAAAATSIKRALLEELNPLMRARLLPVQVEIAIEQCDLDEARKAVEESEEIAKQFESPALHGAAHYVRGALQLAENASQDAIRTLRRSLAVWQEVDVPFEAGRTRVLLGKAYRQLADEEGAVLEFQAAKSAFQKLGAMTETKKVLELLGSDESEQTSFRAASDRVTKTIMFTDIVGSTNLLEAIGDEAWENLIEWHDKTLRSLIAEHTGEEIRSQGDGFVVAFSDPTNAIDCAVHIQRALAEHRKKAGFSPQVRIGLHMSELSRRGLDYAGKGIHEAARIGALASGGQILVSKNTLEASRSSCRTSEPMSVTLKGIAETVEVLPIEWR
jgi:class 3 adenylate cyclase